MTLATATLERNETRDPKIINLFETDSQTSFIGLESIISAILGNPKFERYLQEYTEMAIYSNYLKLFSATVSKIDNPFDSIYIADLKPDSISHLSSDPLLSFAKKIEDRSSEIMFNDGLDE